MGEPVNLIIIGFEEGDWEGIYANGELYAEDHSIRQHDWINLIQEFKIFSGKIDTYIFTEEEIDELGGHLPHYIKDIPKEFFNPEPQKISKILY